MTLRVLHLNSPLGVAGAERVLLTYLDHHDRSRIEVFLASFLNHERLSNSFTQEMDSRCIAFHRIPLSGLGIAGPVVETVRLIRANAIDVIHSHGYRADVTGLMASLWTGVPIVSTLHGWTPVSRKLRIYEGIDRLCLRFFKRIFCVTSHIVEDLAQAGVPTKKLIHLPNAISADILTAADEDIREEFGIDRNEKIILFVGRLSGEKGAETLIAACARLFRSISGCRLLIVGDGPLRNNLEGVCRELGIERRVIFCGHRQKVAPFYKHANMLVIPSWTEGVPMALLEALMFSLPAVCSRVGGIPQIVEHGRTGLLVEAGDVLALELLIRQLLTDEQFARALGTNGHLHVKNEYSVAPWASRMEEVYRQVAKQPQSMAERKTV